MKTGFARYAQRHNTKVDFSYLTIAQLVRAPEISLTDVVEAIRGGDMREVTAASLGRVFQHAQQAGTKSFGIVTSWRAQDRATGKPFSREQNLRNLEHLKGLIAGRGFFPLEGRWVDDTTGKTESEPSFFVPGMTLAEARSIREMFDQDAVVYAGPETDGNVTLLTAGGDDVIGKFHVTTPDQIAGAYSAVKGRGFVFASRASSWSEAMVLSRAKHS
jgi:hypothetical protein